KAQERLLCRAAVSPVAFGLGSSAGHRRDRALRVVDPADAVAAGVGDVQVFMLVERQSGRKIELSARGCASISQTLSTPRVEGGDRAIEPHHAIAGAVGDEEHPFL